MSGPVAISDEIDAVCAAFDCTPTELASARRSKHICTPRHIAMYLARKLTERSLTQIGDALSRDHTSVSHGIERFAARLEGNPQTAELVEAISIAAQALAAGRRKGLLPVAREMVTPAELARRIVTGGTRAAIRATPDEILMLAQALLIHEEEPEALEGAASLEARGIHPAPVFVEPPPPIAQAPEPIAPPRSPPPPPPSLFDIVHDFIGVEAMLRTKPSPALRKARGDFLAQLRGRQGESAQVAAVLEAYDAMVQAEWSLGERAANERYAKAVRALADVFFKRKEFANA